MREISQSEARCQNIIDLELRAESYIVGLYSETELNTVCQDEGER